MPYSKKQLAVKRANTWKAFRKKNLLTQRQLAFILGIHRKTIINIELCRELNPRFRTLVRFASLVARYQEEKHD